MSSAPIPDVSSSPSAPAASSRVGLYVISAVALAGLVSSSLLWQKLGTIQEQLARQSADR